MARSIGYFISSHGLGHAARAAAVIEAVSGETPGIAFHIFTLVEPWFFQARGVSSITVHRMKTDVGLVQRDPFNEDILKTIRVLNSFYPLNEDLINETAGRLVSLECDLVLCDIAPLGIAAAARAGITSILIENFTWDWIYSAYTSEVEGLTEHIDYLKTLFESADYLVQAEPVCVNRRADLRANCVSRSPRRTISETRRLLGVDDDHRLILVTVGGMDGSIALPHGPGTGKDEGLILACPGPSLRRAGNVLWIPKGPDFFYPDIVNASDVVVGKLGYSTLAESFNCGIPFGYVMRERFPESSVLAAFLDGSGRGFPIKSEAIADGSWIAEVERLLALGRRPSTAENGSHQIARFIASLLE